MLTFTITSQTAESIKMHHMVVILNVAPECAGVTKIM